MARDFHDNWAYKIVRRGMDRKARPEQIASELARAPEFIRALKEGVDGDQSVPGGDGAEQALANIAEVLVQPAQGVGSPD